MIYIYRRIRRLYACVQAAVITFFMFTIGTYNKIRGSMFHNECHVKYIDRYNNTYRYAGLCFSNFRFNLL